MRGIDILTQILEVLAALAAAPLFVGWVNQCRAWLQNRSAPSLWLPYRGIRKLFHKEAVIADTASPLFRSSPYVVFGAMTLAAATNHPLHGGAPAARHCRRCDSARRTVRHGPRLPVARGDRRRHRVRYARRPSRDDGGVPRRTRAPHGALRRLAHLSEHCVARD